MAAIDYGKLPQPQAPHRPIDTLFPCLAVVLGETGKFFRNPALHDPKHLNYTKGKLNKLITGANQEFQDALDEIEIQILDAKAVMERDLALVRTKRAERERAAAGLKPPSPSYRENSDTLVKGDMNIESGEKMNREPEKNDAEDVIMTNGQSNSGTHDETGIENGENQVETHERNENLATSKLNVGVGDVVGLTALVEAPENTKGQTKPGQTDFEATTQPAQALGTPTIPDFQDVNFESMFNNDEEANGNDQMDFDLDFATDTNTAEDFLNHSAFENITMSNEEVKNLNTSNEDINALLPGLENFVNAGDEFSLTDIPASNSAVLHETNNGSGTTNPATSAIVAPVEQAPIESNFDDFFASGNYMDEGGDDDMGGDGGVGDFDDAWFATDINKSDGSQ